MSYRRMIARVLAAATVMISLASCINALQIKSDDDQVTLHALATSVEPTGAGSVVLAPNADKYYLGAVVDVAAEPATGYTFTHWSGAITGEDATGRIEIAPDSSVTAHFTRNGYAVEVGTVGAGEVGVSNVSASDEPVRHGDEVELTAVAEEGWVFQEWSGAVTGSANPVRLSVTNPAEVEATFVPITYEVLTETDGDGAVTFGLADGAERAEHGSEVAFTAVPGEGQRFVRWEADGEGSRNPVVLPITTQTTVRAVFEPSAYRLLTFTEGAGTVGHALLDGDSLLHGGRVRFTATPAAGWEFSHWSGTLGGTQAAQTVTVGGDVEATAWFTPEVRIISTHADGSGSVRTSIIDGSSGFHDGTRLRLTAEADPGWAFLAWDGDLTGTANPTERTVDGDMTATAQFVRLDYDVAIGTDGSGSITETYQGQVMGFAEVRLDATADPGWEFSHWSGDVSGEGNPTTVVLNADTSATAHFVRSEYVVDTPVSGSGAVAQRVIGGGPIVQGSEVELTAQPSSAWSFSHWGSDRSDRENPRSLTVSGNTTIPAVFIKNEWTIAVYMSGDNDLEANLIDDINEMEQVDTFSHGVNLVVLADRSAAHDTSNGNWSGTRAYRIAGDSGGENGVIVSERRAVPQLGLAAGGDHDELNMGSSATLSGFLDWTRAEFAAERTALVMWGHGGGYRSATGYPSSFGARSFGSASLEAASEGTLRKPYHDPEGVRAVAADDESGDDLSTGELARALAGREVDVIGFDLCGGAMLEVAYELRDRADYMIASQDVIGEDGWAYDDWLSRFVRTGSPGTSDLRSAIIDSFAESYQHTSGAAISAVRLDRIGAVHARLNDFVNRLHATTASNPARSAVRDAIFRDAEDFYTTPGDLNIDVWSMAEVVRARFSYADAQASALKSAVDDAVIEEWHHGQGNPGARGIAVHFVPLTAGGNPTDHADEYRRGAIPGQLDFVGTSSWVPVDPAGPGLLYRLWYETLP